MDKQTDKLQWLRRAKAVAAVTCKRFEAVYSYWWYPISELQSITCHMVSHSCTSHWTKVNANHL